MESRTERMTHLATRVGAAAAMAMMLLALGVVRSGVAAGASQDGDRSPRGKAGPDGGKGEAGKKEAPPQAKVKLGLSINEPGALRGYTLLNPMNKKTTYLIDREGRVVRTWESEHNSMHAAHLLENGHLFRVAVFEGGERAFGGGPGSAGRIQEFDWDGKLVWDYQFHNDKQYFHHDAAKLPNGNVLMVVWDKKTADEAIAAGRKKELVSDYVLPDSIVEVKPTGKTTGEVVWEWHLWDHLVQDHDATRANYGDVASHPERVDINFVEDPMGGPRPLGPPGPVARKAGPDRDPTKDAMKKAEAEKLKTIGYVGSPTAAGAAGQPGLDPRQRGGLQRRARPDRDQRARIRRDLDHRPQHHQGRGRRPRRRPLGQGRRPALPLGESPRLPRRHQGRPDALRPAQRPVDPPRPPGRGAPARLQQRRAPARRQLFVGRRDGPPGRRARAVQARAGIGLRAQDAGVELLGGEEARFLRLLHLRRPPAPQRQHVHLLRTQWHALRGDARQAGGLEIREPREGRVRPRRVRPRRSAAPESGVAAVPARTSWACRPSRRRRSSRSKRPWTRRSARP